jgi:hypothetical protein
MAWTGEGEHGWFRIAIAVLQIQAMKPRKIVSV